MGARRVGDLVAGLDDRVHRRVDADRQAGERDVVVDRGRDPDDPDRPVAGFFGVAQVECSGQRAVAADDDQSVDARVTEHVPGGVAHPALVELRTARRLEDRSAAPQDVADRERIERRELTVDQTAVAVPDPDRFVSERKCHDRGRPDRGVHARRIAAAREDPDSHVVLPWCSGVDVRSRSSPRTPPFPRDRGQLPITIESRISAASACAGSIPSGSNHSAEITRAHRVSP